MSDIEEKQTIELIYGFIKNIYIYIHNIRIHSYRVFMVVRSRGQANM